MFITLLQIETSNLLNQSSRWADKFIDWIVSYGPKIIGAILLYIIGSFIIGKIAKLAQKAMSMRAYDPSLRTFLLSLVKVALNVLLIVSIFGVLGVDTTAFAALIVGAGVAIGSALNGTLGNFAGGMMMLIFKPFKVGDIIEAQGVLGTVIEQGVFATTMLTPENKTVYVPNGPLSSGTIINFNTHGNLRVDLKMGIALDVPVEKARAIALEAMQSHPDVLKDPAPQVAVLEVANGMTLLAIRPYATQAGYWNVYFGVQELVKKAFDEHGIAAPIPHRVIIQK